MRFHFYPALRPSHVAEVDWQSWHWQMRHGLSQSAEFAAALPLSGSEGAALQRNQIESQFQVRSTPYYVSLVRPDDLQDPLRKIMLPQVAEWQGNAHAQFDPLNERRNNPAPRLIHRYPDRILFLVTDICSVYCRYCTRKHFTGQEQAFLPEAEYQQALNYIRRQTGVREVILSGGDPLTLSDQRLDRVLGDLRAIEHLEIIRIGTRMPVVCPMRVTSELVQILKKYNPVYIMTHFNHPRELTWEAKQALERIVDAGLPTFNQMVLLQGVNNDVRIVQALSRRLLYLRVKPYYMFQCDPSRGTDHLRTSLDESEAIQKELWGNLSGLAMPTLSVDIPSGGGKTTLVPNFERARNSESRTYQGWDGVTETYWNPKIQIAQSPSDAAEYDEEWRALKNAKSPRPDPSEHTLPQTFSRSGPETSR